MIFKERLTQTLVDIERAGEFSGVVLVQRDQERLFEGAYGIANRSWDIRNKLDTRFRIASISKMFTAVAILGMIDDGKLSFDTSVTECLGLEKTSIPEEVTIYHLLTMTSGIADWFDESGNWEEDWSALCREHPIYLFRSHEDYLPLFINEKPFAALGEKHQYNGAGYILLGMIIEMVSGLSYFDAIQHLIFNPASMSRSGFPALDDPAPGVAEGYLQITGDDDKVIGWKKNIYSTTPEAVADGGATSTAT